jgi:hypothetical protein
MNMEERTITPRPARDGERRQPTAEELAGVLQDLLVQVLRAHVERGRPVPIAMTPWTGFTAGSRQLHVERAAALLERYSLWPRE